MHVELNYGKGTLPVELPDSLNVTVIRKPVMPIHNDPTASVARALSNPVAARPLREEARGVTSACILICDITRPVPNGLLLPQIVRALLDGGIAAHRILILVATGLHRPNEGDELAELIGDPWVLQTIPIANHFARNDDDHVLVGTTAAGTVVRLDKRFVHADLKIVTGLVEPHFMAGFSGGRKVIAPGVAHAETITTFHNARFMSHPRADNCVLDDNPLHREQLEIVRLLGRVLAVNTVIDEHRRLSFVNYGEVVESHLEAVRFIKNYAEVPVPQRFSTVLTSAAGYPLDTSYYQTVKGMVAPLDILEPGGNLIVASECAQGIGSEEYRDAQRRLLKSGMDGFFADISRRTHAEIDEWQTQMQLKPMRRGTVHLYSTGLQGEDRNLTGVNLIDSISAAVLECTRTSRANDIAVIPEGPYVVPVYRAANLAAV